MEAFFLKNTKNVAVSHWVFNIKSCVLPRATLKYKIQNALRGHFQGKKCKQYIFKLWPMFSPSPLGVRGGLDPIFFY